MPLFLLQEQKCLCPLSISVNIMPDGTKVDLVDSTQVRQGATAAKTMTDWRAARKGGAGETEVGSEPSTREEAFTDVAVSTISDENQVPLGSGNSTAPTTVVSAASGVWSQEQEVALVQALKAVPKEDDDRWGKVAILVEGKSKAECAKRFKELKATFKKK